MQNNRDRELYNNGFLDDSSFDERDYKNFLQMEESNYDYSTGCEVGVGTSCGLYEECVQNNHKTRGGLVLQVHCIFIFYKYFFF